MNEVIDTLVRETLAALADRRPPVSTYRLQFHAGFTFRDAERIVPYLHELGVTHCYASPYLKARPGSQHGYDISDHRALNPEVGSEEEFAAWTAALRGSGMGHILDMVPNHMGILSNENAWWQDILENGPASPYAGFFDIAWSDVPRSELAARVLLPVLGDVYGKVLESQQLRLDYAAGAFAVVYYEQRLPVEPRSYALVLGHTLGELMTALDKEAPGLLEFQSILTSVKNLAPRTETDSVRLAERQREKEVVKRRLAALTESSPEVRGALEKTVALFNGTPGEPHSFNLLDELLREQVYRLAYWRVASDEINYRRFFDINELAALSMEREEVFTAAHELVLRLLRDGLIDGLRIDHPDGLFDPRQYLERLQEHFVLACARQRFEARPDGGDWNLIERPLRERIRAALREDEDRPARPPLYVVVEKILVGNETLPADWPNYGTTGYDFLNMIGGLFVETGHATAFSRLYGDWVPDTRHFSEVVYRNKYFILQSALSSELNMLAHQLDRLAQRDRWSRDFTLNGLRHTLRHLIACFPVYRSYISDEGLSETDRRYLLKAVRCARPRNASLSPAVFDFVRDTLMLKPPRPEVSDMAYAFEQRRFAGKFQQVTAPVMAKGMEDTSFYVWNRLLSLNEVGGDPERFGVAPVTLHRWLEDRRAKYPWALSTTTTHDTKRSEDARARISVLSEWPREWAERLTRWGELNRSHKVALEEATAPDPNEEYLLYQTLIGAWPLEPYTQAEYARFVERVQAYMQKALHEAKVHTSWINPDSAYDEAVGRFVARILDPRLSATFLADVGDFQRRIDRVALFGALSQALLKLTAPGVPDTYQGTELWDFSLTDPDNRRPVDYERRRELLAGLRERIVAGPNLRGLARELAEKREDGRIKMYVTHRALCLRRDQPDLFTTGDYIPAEIAGARAECAFGFARRHENQWAVIVVPRLLTRLPADTLPLGAAWQDTAVRLPELAGRPLRNVFTGEELAVGPDGLALERVFGHFPVALLASLPA